MARDSCWDVHENNENCSCAFLPSSPFLCTLLSFPHRLNERMTVPKPFPEWRKRNQAKTLQPAYAQTCENITVQRAKRFRIMFLHLIFSAQGACGVAGVHRGLARALPKWHVQSCGAKTSSISRPTKPDLSSLTRSLSEECPLGLLALRIA